MTAQGERQEKMRRKIEEACGLEEAKNGSLLSSDSKEDGVGKKKKTMGESAEKQTERQGGQGI
jgi:hypothetical protein